MRPFTYLSAAFAIALTLGAAPAVAKNICQAENLTCATTMPVDGYCECTSHGQTQSGTVVASPAPQSRVNSTAGGCGSQPNSSGCR